MESINPFPSSPTQENLPSKEHLQAICEEINEQINRYDYYIRLQLEDTIKNFNLCVALCEEKLSLVKIHEDYKTVLTTLSTEKKDLSTANKIWNRLSTQVLFLYDKIMVLSKDSSSEYLMVSERDPHE